MPTFFPLLIGVLFQLLFAAFLGYFGWNLFRMQSLKKTLDEYRAHPERASFFVKYLLGFALMNVAMTEWSIKAFGDRLLTGWYRIAGLFFLSVSIFVPVAIVLLFWLNIRPAAM